MRDRVPCAGRVVTANRAVTIATSSIFEVAILRPPLLRCLGRRSASTLNPTTCRARCPRAGSPVLPAGGPVVRSGRRVENGRLLLPLRPAVQEKLSQKHRALLPAHPGKHPAAV